MIFYAFSCLFQLVTDKALEATGDMSHSITSYELNKSSGYPVAASLAEISIIDHEPCEEILSRNKIFTELKDPCRFRAFLDVFLESYYILYLTLVPFPALCLDTQIMSQLYAGACVNRRHC